MKELSRTFGSRLTQLRRVRGWTQRELSHRAEIDPGRLSKLERGIARVSVPELIRLASALDTGLDELVFGSAVRLEGEWHRLLGKLKKTGGSRAVDCATRLLQALVLGYSVPTGVSEASEAEHLPDGLNDPQELAP